MYKVGVLNNVSQKGLDLLGANFEIVDQEPLPGEIQAVLLRSAKLDTEKYPSLLAVGRAGSGVNNITVDAASAKGVCVFNAPGANANAVNELVFSVLGLDARNLFDSVQWVKTLTEFPENEIRPKVESGKKQFAGYEWAGKTIGVIGLGQIGILVANGGIGRDMETIAYDPYPQPENMHRLARSVKVVEDLCEVADQADVLTVHVPLNQKTQKLIDATVLDRFKGTHVLNFARDGIVDDDEVLARLDNGSLERYITDFPTRKLLEHPKVVCLPHLGASTGEAQVNCAVMVSRQVRDYLDMGIVKNSVNFPDAGRRPDPDVRQRIVVITPDKVGMVNSVTEVLKDARVNIRSLVNASNGKVGYNLIDVDPEQEAISESILETIHSNPDMIRARIITIQPKE